jgi:NADPH:quinone reductase-like Zn-dependent oxidoreductase
MRSFTVLKTGGHLVSAVSVPDQKMAMAQGVTARFFLVKVTTDYLNRIAALIDEGQLRTNVTTVLPLAARSGERIWGKDTGAARAALIERV